MSATDSVTEGTEISTGPTSIPSTETRQPTEETMESFTQSISSTLSESTSVTTTSNLISTCSCGATESTVFHHEPTSNVIMPIHPTTKSYQLIPQITVLTVTGTVVTPSPPLFQQKDNLFILYSGRCAHIDNTHREFFFVVIMDKKIILEKPVIHKVHG